MSGFMTTNTDHMIVANLFSNDLKETFPEVLIGKSYVDWMTDFPHGDTWNIPSIGNLQVLDYVEGQKIRYGKMDTGNFTFSLTDYVSSGVKIYDKFKQDSMYAPKIMAQFVPEMNKAIAERLETDILALGPEYQAAGTNTINGAYHRWVSGGTNQVMEIEDFAKADYALKKANAPMTNKIAIVDPSVAVSLTTQAITNNISNNKMWEGVIETGLVKTGLRFDRNIMGWDIYVSNFLKTGVNETTGGATSGAGVANIFFSAAPGASPFVGAFRQMPRVESERNKDDQSDEFLVTARYGLGVIRPECLMVVITDTDQVYA